MPGGDETTVPAPVRATVSVFVLPLVPATNCAITLCMLLAVMMHAPMPEHGPNQPANVLPAPGVAVSITVAPAGYAAWQVAPHAMRPSPESTEPVPEPAR